LVDVRLVFKNALEMGAQDWFSAIIIRQDFGSKWGRQANNQETKNSR
jgi:hypothetical protein